MHWDLGSTAGPMAAMGSTATAGDRVVLPMRFVAERFAGRNARLALFSLQAIDAWFAAHPEPERCYGEDPRAWDNPPVVKTLAEDPGWVGEMVGDVRMVVAWRFFDVSVDELLS